MPRRVTSLAVTVPTEEPETGGPGTGTGSGGAVKSGEKRREKRGNRRFSPYNKPQPTVGLSGPLDALHVGGPVSSRTRRANRFAFHPNEIREVESLRDLMAAGPPSKRAAMPPPAEAAPPSDTVDAAADAVGGWASEGDAAMGAAD